MMPPPESFHKLFVAQGGSFQSYPAQSQSHEFHALPELEFHALKIFFRNISRNLWGVESAALFHGHSFKKRKRNYHKKVLCHNGRSLNELPYELLVVFRERAHEVVLLVLVK